MRIWQLRYAISKPVVTYPEWSGNIQCRGPASASAATSPGTRVLVRGRLHERGGKSVQSREISYIYIRL
jgi:hypothetical protein